MRFGSKSASSRAETQWRRGHGICCGSEAGKSRQLKAAGAYSEAALDNQGEGGNRRVGSLAEAESGGLAEPRDERRGGSAAGGLIQATSGSYPGIAN